MAHERGTDEYSREIMATGGLWMLLGQGRGLTAETVFGPDGQATPEIEVTFEATLGEMLGHSYRLTVHEIEEDDHVG